MKTPYRPWFSTLVPRTLALVGWLVVNAAAMATPSYAYIGPGSGLSALGSLLALVAAIVVAIIGFVWFPLKRILRKRKMAAGPAQDEGGNEERK